jgi:hypothetical protein
MAKKSLELEIVRLQAAQEIQNVMSRYVYMHTAGLHKECVSLFTAKRDDAKLEMMWGIYEGKDAAYRCYTIDHLNLEGQGEQRRGRMQMHTLTTPCIVVAGDGKTGKGAWISPGHETAAGKSKALANWAWCKYGADFIQEDGQWKIWHLRVYGIFMTAYDKPWSEVAETIGSHDDFMTLMPGVTLEPGEPPTFKYCNDRPPSSSWEYRPDALYPFDQPLPPQPYETWDDSMSYVK